MSKTHPLVSTAVCADCYFLGCNPKVENKKIWIYSDQR